MAPISDLVILLPGITGSVLADAQGREVWAPSLGAAWRAITSLGDSIQALELAGDDVDDGVVATRLVPDATLVPGLVKIDGYTRIEQELVRRLGLVPGENYHAFPYDWRRDNRVTARRLQSQAMDWLAAWRTRSGRADAKLVLIGHSMGGLVARYFVECLGGWQHTRRLVTLGTPHRGSVDAVGFIEHGMKKGIGPLGIDLSPLLRSFTSVYQLLPIYPCIAEGVGRAWLRPAEACAAGFTQHLQQKRATAARAFHQEIQDAQARNAKEAAYPPGGLVVPLVGIEQPTQQSAVLRDGRLDLLQDLGGTDAGGDGTVPRVSATPIELSDAAHEIYAAEMHGALQNNDGTLANLHGLLTREQLDLRKFMRASDRAMLRLELDDVVLPGEALRVRVRASEGNPRVRLRLEALDGSERFDEALAPDTAPDTAPENAPDTAPGRRAGAFALSPGRWRVTAYADDATPVSDLVVVAS